MCSSGNCSARHAGEQGATVHRASGASIQPGGEQAAKCQHRRLESNQRRRLESARLQFPLCDTTGASRSDNGLTNMLPAVQLKLWEASETGDAAELKRCLDVGAKVAIKNRLGWNAMHRACMSGSTVCVALLLPEEEKERTELLDTPDGAGYLPLHIACGFGHAKLVELLAKAGAKVDAPMVKEDSARDTAMHTACKALSDAPPERQAAYLGVIIELLKRGGLLESQDAKGRMAASFLTKPLQTRLLGMLKPPAEGEEDEEDDEEGQDEELVVAQQQMSISSSEKQESVRKPQSGASEHVVEERNDLAPVAAESLNARWGEQRGTLL